MSVKYHPNALTEIKKKFDGIVQIPMSTYW